MLAGQLAAAPATSPASAPPAMATVVFGYFRAACGVGHRVQTYGPLARSEKMEDRPLSEVATPNSAVGPALRRSTRIEWIVRDGASWRRSKVVIPPSRIRACGPPCSSWVVTPR